MIILSGYIVLDPICDIDFGSALLSSISQQYEVDSSCYLSVSDYKGNNLGWAVTMSADDLVNEWATIGSGILDASNIALMQTGGRDEIEVLAG